MEDDWIKNNRDNDFESKALFFYMLPENAERSQYVLLSKNVLFFELI